VVNSIKERESTNLPPNLTNEIERNNLLSKKDLWKTFRTWYFTTELSNSYERLQALAFCNALEVNLREIYKDDKEAYPEALTRHLQFYNSEGTFGSIIHGVVLSMEEEKGQGGDIAPEVITGFKTGLMGPVAGIGDTLMWGTLKPIILGLACSFALSGNVLGAAIPFLYPLLIVIIGFNLLTYGYSLGRESVMRLMKSGMIDKVINGASILGLFMMGALSSTYVKVSTPVSFSVKNAEPIVLQDMLNQILPGLLPLSVIFGIYFYFKKKGQNYNKVLFGIITLSLVTALLGILG
jgi:D-glucosaminate PTS system EIID component